jgi:hypothetical protein
MWNISWTMLLLSKRLLRKLGVDDTKEIFCFTAATLVSVFAWNAEAATYELVRQPIESIEVGDRVVTHDGDINERNEGLNPQDYRKLTVRTVCVCPDGSVDEIRVSSLVERNWLDRHLQHREGRLTAPLDLTAMGLDEVVSADVVSVEPCPEICDGPGQIVMTTVTHLNRHLVHLTIESELGQRETIESTAYHKFFSKSRGDWVSAIELEPNEVLEGLGGSLVVVQVLPVEGEETVFNLSVRGDHVYRVGRLGVLVHNDDCDGLSSPLNISRFLTPKSFLFPRRTSPSQTRSIGDEVVL